MFVYMGYEPTLVVSSADQMAKEIMKTHDIAYGNRSASTASKLLFYVGTDIAFLRYGEYWMKARKTYVKQLLSVHKEQHFKSVREEEVTIVIPKISRSCSVGSPINVSDMILALIHNIMSKYALGTKPEAEDGKNKFGELSRQFSKLFEAFSFGCLFPWLRWIDILTGLVRRMKVVSGELDTHLDQIINEHLTGSRHGDDSNSKKDFVDLLLHVQENDMNFTRDNIKTSILALFFGGNETTSATIEWAFAELIKHPHTMKKAQEEVRRVVGKKHKVEEEDIKEMHYLKSVIKEALRLHPAGPLIPRASSMATNVKGYHVPPNTQVCINLWAIQRDPKEWDRPEEFIPDRFINNTIDYKGQHYEYIPFGSRQRICPGMSFGITVAEFVLANLLYCYDWKLPGGAHGEELDMAENSGIPVSKKNIPLLHFA